MPGLRHRHVTNLTAVIAKKTMQLGKCEKQVYKLDHDACHLLHKLVRLIDLDLLRLAHS